MMGIAPDGKDVINYMKRCRTGILMAVISISSFSSCVEDKEIVTHETEAKTKERIVGYKTALPISYLEKYNSMLAYQVNYGPLQDHDGFPLRLIAFGKYGYKWAKWVSKLRIINESQLGYWEKLGFSDQANVSLDRRRYYEGDSIKPLEY